MRSVPGTNVMSSGAWKLSLGKMRWSSKGGGGSGVPVTCDVVQATRFRGCAVGGCQGFHFTISATNAPAINNTATASTAKCLEEESAPVERSVLIGSVLIM